MRKISFKILGISLLILMMTTTSVFGANIFESSANVTGYQNELTWLVDGQHQYGEIGWAVHNGKAKVELIAICESSTSGVAHSKSYTSNGYLHYYMAGDCQYYARITGQDVEAASVYVQNYL